MKWSEPKPPTEGVSYYDHVKCATPLGECMIEWKSWKGSPGYDVVIGNEWIGVEDDLETAKTLAVSYLIKKREEINKFLNIP